MNNTSFSEPIKNGNRKLKFVSLSATPKRSPRNWPMSYLGPNALRREFLNVSDADGNAGGIGRGKL